MNKNQTLLDGTKLLDELEIPYFLTGGALLGIKRDYQLIEWDNDLDVDVLAEDLTDEKRELLVNSGFLESANILKKVGHYSKRLNDVRFDIFVLFERADKLYRNPCGDTCMWFPKRFYRKIEKIKFLDKWFLTPNPFEEWAVHFYGKDWRTPVKIWSWMQDCKNRCTLEEV